MGKEDFKQKCVILVEHLGSPPSLPSSHIIRPCSLTLSSHCGIPYWSPVTSPPAGPVKPSTLQPSCAPSPWRRMTFFPTGSHIVPASPHARGPGTLQQAGNTSKADRPTAAACRSSSQLQFVIIIKGLTSEASLPLFTPPSQP